MSELVKKRSFRLDTKKLYLTYSQLPTTATKESVIEYLTTILEIKNYMIALEYHKDGNPHIHALLILKNNKDIKNCNLLDLNLKGVIYHGNYQSAKNIHSIVRYLMKAGDYLTDMNIIDGKYFKFDELLILKLKTIGLYATLKYVRDEHPEVLVKRYSTIRNNLTKVWKDMQSEKSNKVNYCIDEYVPHAEINNAMSKQVQLSSWVSGPSGTRKTSYVTALADRMVIDGRLKDYIFIRHVDELKSFDPERHELIIIDDCQLPNDREGLISLFDNERQGAINVKFDVITIPPNVKRIFISNHTFNEMLKRKGYLNDLALIRRINQINLLVPIQLKINVNNIFNIYNHTS